MRRSSLNMRRVDGIRSEYASIDSRQYHSRYRCHGSVFVSRTIGLESLSLSLSLSSWITDRMIRILQISPGTRGLTIITVEKLADLLTVSQMEAECEISLSSLSVEKSLISSFARQLDRQIASNFYWNVCDAYSHFGNLNETDNTWITAVILFREQSCMLNNVGYYPLMNFENMKN